MFFDCHRDDWILFLKNLENMEKGIVSFLLFPCTYGNCATFYSAIKLYIKTSLLILFTSDKILKNRDEESMTM